MSQFAASNIKLIVGLGNVGPKYALTRHNVGFMWVDELVSSYQAKWHENNVWKAYTAEIPFNGEIVTVCKPTTMMNSSGTASE